MRLIGFLVQFKNSKGETPCSIVLELLAPCNVNLSDSSSQSRSSRVADRMLLTVIINSR